MKQAKVLWFTGLSGAGKTTIAQKLAQHFRQDGYKVKMLDGDHVRETLHCHLGFSPEDITENNRLIAELCVKYSKDFDYILVPIISPFRESRSDARKLIGPSFIEVFVKASLDEVMRRDSKGLYQKAIKGEVKNFIGIDENVPYEAPENPEIILDTETEPADALVENVVEYVCGEKEKV